MKTLADLTTTTGLPVDMHLVLDLVIPVSDGMQAQGDLLVVPLAELADRGSVRDDAAWEGVTPGGGTRRGGGGGVTPTRRAPIPVPACGQPTSRTPAGWPSASSTRWHRCT